MLASVCSPVLAVHCSRAIRVYFMHSVQNAFPLAVLCTERGVNSKPYLVHPRAIQGVLCRACYIQCAIYNARSCFSTSLHPTYDSHHVFFAHVTICWSACYVMFKLSYSPCLCLPCLIHHVISPCSGEHVIFTMSC